MGNGDNASEVLVVKADAIAKAIECSDSGRL
jgi:hypothetical protein